MINVVIINGSPKGTNSNTMNITRGFIEGVKEVIDCECEEINIVDKNIEVCDGCLTCLKNEGTCVKNDDMIELFEKYINAELVVWSFPMCFYSMPSLAKKFLDRTLPINNPSRFGNNEILYNPTNKKIPKQRHMVICGSGFPYTPGDFTPLLHHFTLMFGSNVESLCVTEVSLFNIKMAERYTIPLLEHVKRAGKELVSFGKVTTQTKVNVETPMIDMEEYKKLCNIRKVL